MLVMVLFSTEVVPFVTSPPKMAVAELPAIVLYRHEGCCRLIARGGVVSRSAARVVILSEMVLFRTVSVPPLFATAAAWRWIAACAVIAGERALVDGNGAPVA